MRVPGTSVLARRRPPASSLWVAAVGSPSSAGARGTVTVGRSASSITHPG
jgi:hypothetical protein